MEPEKVKPAKFNVHTIIYNNHGFSVAYGIWENGKKKRMAMRWNGDGDDLGYPSQGANPLWFQLPDNGAWTDTILQAIDQISNLENRRKELNSKL